MVSFSQHSFDMFTITIFIFRINWRRQLLFGRGWRRDAKLLETWIYVSPPHQLKPTNMQKICASHQTESQLIKYALLSSDSRRRLSNLLFYLHTQELGTPLYHLKINILLKFLLQIVDKIIQPRVETNFGVNFFIMMNLKRNLLD